MDSNMSIINNIKKLFNLKNLSVIDILVNSKPIVTQEVNFKELQEKFNDVYEYTGLAFLLSTIPNGTYTIDKTITIVLSDELCLFNNTKTNTKIMVKYTEDFVDVHYLDPNVPNKLSDEQQYYAYKVIRNALRDTCQLWEEHIDILHKLIPTREKPTSLNTQQLQVKNS